MKRDTIAAWAIAMQAQVPSAVIGEPGTGKTETFKAIMRRLQWPYGLFTPSVHEPQDIGGYGVPNPERKMVDLYPIGGWIEAPLKAGYGAIFIDEFTWASPMMQGACLKLVQERVLGEIVLPHTVVPVLAMNSPEDAGGANSIIPPMASRIIHLPWDVDPETVINGFLGAWPEPEVPILAKGWEEGLQNARLLIISFLKTKPQLMQAKPKEEAKRSGPWPSIRTWYDLAAPCYAASEAAGLNEERTYDIKALLLSSAVGGEATMQFLSWQRNLDLQDPEELLKNPKALKIDDKRLDTLFTTLTAVAQAAIRRLTPDRWVAAWDCLSIAATQGHVMQGASAARYLSANHKAGLPSVTRQVKSFVPLLVAAGIYKAAA